MTDGSVEALLAGRDDEVPDDLADVAAVLHAARASAQRPSVPTADLIDLFTEGAEPQPEPHEAPGPRPIAVGRRWFGPALQRIGALGAAAKLALVAVLGVAGVTGAGAAGALPDGLQDRLAGTVGVVSPFDFPTTADDRAEVGADVSEDATDPEAPGVDGGDVADDVIPEELTPVQPDVPVAPAHPDRGLGEARDTPAGERLPGEAEDPPADEGTGDDPPAGSDTGDENSEEPPAGPEAGDEHRWDPPTDPPPDGDAVTSGSTAASGGTAAADGRGPARS